MSFSDEVVAADRAAGKIEGRVDLTPRTLDNLIVAGRSMYEACIHPRSLRAYDILEALLTGYRQARDAFVEKIDAEYAKVWEDHELGMAKPVPMNCHDAKAAEAYAPLDN